MKCPYLEEVVVRYCKAFPVKKMIPREPLGQESPCCSEKHCQCDQFRATAFPAAMDGCQSVVEQGSTTEKMKTSEPREKKEVAPMAAAGVEKAPGKERQCIWTKAGVVSYRLCTHDYDCDACEFNQSLLDTSRQYDESPEVFDFASKLRALPADQRKCRYMLTGDISYKLCPNNYNCGACAFDQAMRYSVEMHPRLMARRKRAQKVKAKGFYLHRDYYFHPKHTWAKVMTDGTVRVGLDDFGQGLIGRADGISVPSVGDTLAGGRRAWELRSGNRVAGLVSPVSGVVEEVNPEIEERTGLVNDDPYGKGWIMRIRPFELKRDISSLAKGDDARPWLESDIDRLHSETRTESGVALADGGEPLKRLSGLLSDEDWQHFVKEFLME